MLTYKAMYKFLDDGVHGEVLDFSGVITCGKSLDETRRLLSDALTLQKLSFFGLNKINNPIQILHPMLFVSQNPVVAVH